MTQIERRMVNLGSAGPLGPRPPSRLQRLHEATVDGPVVAVGCTSRAVIDAVLELAALRKRPLLLAARRRQADAEDASGVGYSTETLVDRVRAADPGGYVLLCRDAAGPWQREAEVALGEREAMERAKRSLETDVARGLDVVGLDPGGAPGDEAAAARLLELYDYAAAAIDRHEQPTLLEIPGPADPIALEALLSRTSDFCRRRGYPAPSFVSLPAGCLTGLPAADLAARAGALCAVAARHGAQISEPVDVLPSEELRLRRGLGLGKILAADELGAVEARVLLELAGRSGDEALHGRLLALGSDLAADADPRRAVLAARALLGSGELGQLRHSLAEALRKKGLDLERFVRARLIDGIARLIDGLA